MRERERERERDGLLSVATNENAHNITLIPIRW